MCVGDGGGRIATAGPMVPAEGKCAAVLREALVTVLKLWGRKWIKEKCG